MSDSVPRQSNPPRSNFLRFLNFVWPYRLLLAGASIGGIIKFSVPLFVPEITRHLLDNVYLNPAMTMDEKTIELMTYIGLLIAVLVIVWIPGTFIRHYYAGKASQKAIFDLRHALYYHILRMSASFFDRNKSGSIVSRLIGDVELAQNLIGSALTDVWMDFVSLALILFFLVNIDVGITLAALVTFPIYLYYFRQSQTEIRASSLRVQEEISVMAGKVQEKIAGNRVVHAFTGEKTEEENFDEESMRLLNTAMRRVYLQSTNATVTNFLTQIAPLIVTVYGGYQVIQGTLTIGDIVAVGMYLPPLYTPLQRFAQLNLVFANSMAAVDRVFEVIDEAPEIMDRPDAFDLEPQAAQGRITFKDVSFSYTNEDEAVPVLTSVSFEIDPGEKVAFVGPSGSGKSTIVSLIPRFYDVDDGSVTIGGCDVRDVTVGSLRKQVGMVLQTPILFSGPIRENIRYGRPGASDDDIVKAASQCL